MAKKLTDISSLVPDTKNANQGTERGRFLLEKSFRELGAGRSVVTDAEGRVIGGNKALEIAEELGLPIEVVQTQGDKLVVVQRTDLDLSDDLGPARKLAYFDNQTSAVGLNWSAEQIVADLDTGVDLEGMFRPDELSEILEAAADALMPGEPPEPQVDKAEELREQWQTERGQVWEIGKHRLMCGDSTNAEDVARLMGGEKADAVVTDPPYGQNQDGVPGDEPEKLEQMVAGAVGVLPCANGIVAAFQSPRTFPVWLDAIRAAGQKFERMLWLYKAAQCTFPWRGWILKSESILVSSIGKPQWQDKHPYAHDCYYLSEVSGELGDIGWHGSVKPLSVVVDIVQRISPLAGTLFDGFLGSGTTLVAAEQTGRLCFGMEISEAYVAVTLQRLRDMGLSPRLVEGGASDATE